MIWLCLGIGALLLAGGAYWLFVLSEGAYLGPRAVTWLYDLTARRYDRVKRYEERLEDLTLGRPLADRVGPDPEALVLDVATGTGRVLMSLLRQPEFQGRVIGLDLSARMLEQATGNLAANAGRVTLLHDDASSLPFRDATFDAVTCSEALEFLPDPPATLREMARVLRPGGTLLFTNRIGIEALFLPGKVFPRRTIQARLAELPLRDVLVSRWEANYDQIWARRTGVASGREPNDRLPLTRACPRCQAEALALAPSGASCAGCGAVAERVDGIIELIGLEGPREELK